VALAYDLALQPETQERMTTISPLTGERVSRLTHVYQSADDLTCSPVVSDDLVYIGGPDSYLYAVDSRTGQEKWKFKLDGKIGASLTVAGGTVYAGSLDGYLYAVK
jgi:outer membrane protein assembly factor BamB